MATIDLGAERHVPAAANIRALCAARGPCVSIYLGAHGGAGTPLVLHRLRAHVNEVEIRTRQKGIPDADREALLAPLRELEKNPEMGSGRDDGFAIFRSHDMLRQFRLPGSQREEATLAGRFDVLPALGFIAGNPEFYLLTLTRKNVRLLYSGPSGIEETPLASLVQTDLTQFLALDQPDHTLKNVSHSRSGGELSAGVAFGTGTERERLQGHFHDFSCAIDRAVKSLLVHKGMPLVLAGTRREVTAYRAAGTYEETLDAAVTLSPDSGWTDRELVRRARDLVASSWTPPELRRELVQYAGASKDRTLTEINGIVRAAAEGRILCLFIANEIRIPGDHDTITGRTPPANGFRSDGDDLVNAAAVDTMRHRGQVRFVSGKPAFVNTPLAALLRY